MIISVTGTPGTGKTEVSKKLASLLGYSYLDLNRVAEDSGLITGLDEKRGSKIMNTDGLKEMHIHENSVVDGHLSHFVQADVIVVLRTRPDILKKRISKRKWNREKIRENVEAEILGVCSSEAFETGTKVLEIDTTESIPKETAKSIKAIIDNNKDTEDIDWLENYAFMLGR